MAYEDRRPVNPRDPGGPVPPRRAGWGAGWWIVFFIVVAFIIWAVAWSWGGWGNRNRAVVPPVAPVTTAEGNAQGTATPQVSVAQLSGPGQNGQQFLNQTVRVNDVQVVARAGDQAFWVRGAGGDRLLVVENQNGNTMPQSDQPNSGRSANNQQIRQGEGLSIVGTVQQVNSSNELQQQYGVQKQAASQLKQGEVFLLAQEIYPQDQNSNQSQSDQNQRENRDQNR